MNDRAAMQRLIWKDVATIKPLLIAAAAAVVASNLLLFAIWRSDRLMFSANSYSYLFGWSIALWMLLPNFVAFGAPVMLVGNEEESGTLGWLRTLPIGWQQIAAAKLGVAAVAVLATWVLASIVLWLMSSAWSDSAYRSMEDALSLRGLLTTAFLSASLLLLGFATAYLIRSPLLALISLVPIYSAFAMGTDVLFDEFRWGGKKILLGVAALFVLWLAQRLLAYRRLLLPARNSITTPASSPPSDYGMPRLRNSAQPTQVSSLLWQQIRQSGPLCVVLVGVSTFLAVIFCLTHAGQFHYGVVGVVAGLAPMFILSSACWLGAIVFYGDNVHRRCSFLADRGISPTRIWWTRIVPPGISFVVLLVLVGAIGLVISNEGWHQYTGDLFNVVAITTVLFAFGQLVSQWTDRPLLAFFAAPAYAVVSLSPAFYLMDLFSSDFAVIVLVVPILLVATWRLTPRWLEGGVKANYTARVLAYTGIAVLIPCLWIIGSAIVSRPHLYVSGDEPTSVAVHRTMDTYVASSANRISSDASGEHTP